MSKIVDARGLACPQPVILTKKAMSESAVKGDLTTIVDSDTSAANVARMAEKAGWEVSREELKDGIYLHIVRGAGAYPQLKQKDEKLSATGPLVVYIGADEMGRGAAELGNILIRGFLHTLNEVEPLPDTLIFVNTGVKLVVEGSPVLEDLRMLQDKGAEILACGTCLNYLELTEQVAIGTVSNMYDIAGALLGAGKVVAP